VLFVQPLEEAMETTVLERWADVLLEALRTNEPGATLVRLDRDSAGDSELALRPIDTHPVEALAELDQPMRCHALGVATGAWAAPMGSSVRPSAHPEARRVFQVVLVGQDGSVVSRVRYPDGSVMTEPPGAGAVLDALRTALGLSAVA
jgi:hypothetical protein